MNPLKKLWNKIIGKSTTITDYCFDDNTSSPLRPNQKFIYVQFPWELSGAAYKDDGPGSAEEFYEIIEPMLHDVINQRRKQNRHNLYLHIDFDNGLGYASSFLAYLAGKIRNDFGGDIRKLNAKTGEFTYDPEDLIFIKSEFRPFLREDFIYYWNSHPNYFPRRK